MDFSMKPSVDLASIAALKQKQAAEQAQLDQQASDTREKMISGAIQAASNMTVAMIQRSKQQQKDAFVKNLGDAMAAQVPSITQSVPTQGPGTPDMFNLQPSAPVPGDVSDRTSQFMPGTPGQVGVSQPGENPLPPQTVQTPDVAKQNAVRSAVKLDPSIGKDFISNYLKSTNPTSASNYEIKTGADGKMYRVSKLNPNDVQPIGGPTGFESNAITKDQRNQQMDINQQNADTRGQNADTNQSRFVTVTGDKLANAVDPTKLKDYSRLTASKRLDQFIASTQGKAIDIQVREAAGLLASIVQGGGNGGVVAEKLIDQLTPSTLKGSAMSKLQWLTNNPQSVDQGKFLDLFKKTADREALAAEDNIRQQQVEALKKYEKVKKLDPNRYQQIMDGIGLSNDNVGDNGRFIRTKNTRSILPNYDSAQAVGGNQITTAQLNAAMQRIQELEAKDQGQ